LIINQLPLSGLSTGTSTATGNIISQWLMSGLSEGDSSATGNIMLTMYISGLSEGVTTIQAALAAWRTNPPIKAASRITKKRKKRQRHYTLGRSQKEYTLGDPQEFYNLD